MPGSWGRSGLYDHTKKKRRDRRQEDAALAEQISVNFLQSRDTYGFIPSELVVKAFERAVKNWSAPELHYSDRGVQYAAQDLRQALKSYDVSARHEPQSPLLR
jgi:hypothetical protein